MEILPVVPPHDPIDRLIAQALDKQVSVEALEKLLAMREKYMAEQAENAYNQAMTDFQHECPIIKKTRGVSTDAGILAYRYAPIDSIISQVRELIYKHGFSYHIATEVIDTQVLVHCTVKHIQGHSQVTPYGPIPLGRQTAVMNDSQVVAAAFTYAKRYAFCNAFGIMTGDEDTDGHYMKRMHITEQTLHNLQYSIEEALEYGKDLTRAVFHRYKKEKLDDLTEEQGLDAIKVITTYMNNRRPNIEDGDI